MRVAGVSAGGMIRPALATILFLAASAASSSAAAGAERRFPVGSFDRVRVEGAFEVTHATGSPNARVSGDARAIERVQLRVDGGTLVVRMGARTAGEGFEDGSAGPITVTLSSPALRSVLVSAGGRLTAGRVKGTRLDLTLGGSGAIAVADVAADQLSATLVGTGTITLAGRVATVRLVSNGSGRIDAGRLQADALTVLSDGPGEVKAQARYTATITNLGLGAVAVAGSPKCTVAARAGGPVACGR